MALKKYTVKKKGTDLYVKPGKKHELTRNKNEAVKMTFEGIRIFFKNLNPEEFEITKL